MDAQTIEATRLDQRPVDNAGLNWAGSVDEKSGLKILLTEDDEADAYLIKRALQNHPRVGEIVHVRDGVEAIELIDRRVFRPDLAFVDLKMPRKDGFALLSELDLRATADFPIVVLTSSRAGADRLRAGHRGAARFVTKPNSIEKLTKTLNDVIARI